MHHIDVVPAEGEWQVPPFAGVFRDGYLWGRGAVDAKSLGIAHLAALIDLKRSGVPRQRDVLFLAVADEENGGGRGTAWLLQEHGELFADIEVVLNEGGGNRTVNGRTVWWGVEVAQKRPLWLRLSTRGRGGHGSGFNPQSAAHRLIAALDRLVSAPPQYRVTPAVRQYLGAIAPLHNPRMRRLFEDLDSSVTSSGLSELFAPGMAGLFLDTVQVTVLAGSARINSVTEVATAEVDIRLLPDTDGDAFLGRIQEILGRDVQVEVLLRFPSTPATAADQPMYAVLRSIFEAEGQGPVVPTFISGFTDSRFFRHRGIAAYGVSPFTLEPQDLMGIHGRDEKISLLEFNNGTERMKRIVGGYVSKLPDTD
jgi:acetylornithine deacetylase/succinyl-diaminopimelate desuccinylase-like protein